MACPKSVANCPDRVYKAHNAGNTIKSKDVNGVTTTTTVIGGKVYTVSPRR